MIFSWDINNYYCIDIPSVLEAPVNVNQCKGTVSFTCTVKGLPLQISWLWNPYSNDHSQMEFLNGSTVVDQTTFSVNSVSRNSSPIIESTFTIANSPSCISAKVTCNGSNYIGSNTASASLNAISSKLSLIHHAQNSNT